MFEIVFSGGKGLLAELVDRNGSLDVLQAMLAEIGERDAVDEGACGVREHDLAPMGGSPDSRREVHIVPHVPLSGHGPRAIVQADRRWIGPGASA